MDCGLIIFGSLSIDIYDLKEDISFRFGNSYRFVFFLSIRERIKIILNTFYFFWLISLILFFSKLEGIYETNLVSILIDLNYFCRYGC